MRKTEEIIETLIVGSREMLEEAKKNTSPEILIVTAIYAVGTNLAQILANIEEKLDET